MNWLFISYSFEISMLLTRDFYCKVMVCFENKIIIFRLSMLLFFSLPTSNMYVILNMDQIDSSEKEFIMWQKSNKKKVWFAWFLRVSNRVGVWKPISTRTKLILFWANKQIKYECMWMRVLYILYSIERKKGTRNLIIECIAACRTI